MLATNCEFDFTKRIVRPDGRIRRVRCVGIPAIQTGALRGFVETGIDVTEQEPRIGFLHNRSPNAHIRPAKTSSMRFC